MISLELERDARWHTYGETCRMAGTPEQRQWACDQAMKTERALTAELLVAAKRAATAEKRAKAKAVRG